VPNRIIRESSLTSDTLDKLSAEAERLFFRLTIVADDKGRFNADPRVILARCYPLRVGRMKAEQVSRWVQELAKSEAIILYAHGDPAKTYGHFPNWEKYQRVYGLHSKFPAPTEESRIVPHSAGSSGKFTPDAESKRLKAVMDALPMANQAFDLFWSLYPSRNGKKLEKDETQRRFLKLSPVDQTICCQATKNYAASQPVKDGIGIRDPKRFLQDDKGHEFWREWVTPETPTANGKDATCRWSVKVDGSQKMKDCGEPIAPSDVNPAQRPFCVKCLPLRVALDKQLKGG
jgi:hypothetical protein